MWNDIKENGLVVDVPVIVRQDNGIKAIACYHQTRFAKGIVKLEYKGNAAFSWDGQTYLIKVTHWREIEPEELEETQKQCPTQKG